MEYHSGGSLPLLGRPRYCAGPNANGGYLCETGHCCGETGCCTYYYELWWFWLLWTVLILFSCCCAYRHRRAKLRVQQQQRQREISLLAYHGASYHTSMLDLSFLASLKLPSYEEVAAQPSTPPPPYSSVFTTPRYPQPPRTTDPHLHTQHGPLLHRPLSDGPSSLSSDNSSSCSCDSCCPSSPCSSSLSAPVTYETDTSHASTPSEAAPLTLDVTIETMASAAACLEAVETHLVSDMTTPGAAGEDVGGDGGDVTAQEATATGLSAAVKQTVTVAVVTRAASPQPLASPGSAELLAAGTSSPVVQQLDPASCIPMLSTCSTNTVTSTVNTSVPTTLTTITEGPTTPPSPIQKITLNPCSCTAVPSTSEAPAATSTLDLALDAANGGSSPTSELSPVIGKALTPITSSTTSNLNPTLAPDGAPSPSPTLTPDLDSTIPTLNPLTLNPERLPSSVQALDHPDSALVIFSSTEAGAGRTLIVDPSPVLAGSDPSMVLSRIPESDLNSPLPSDTQPCSCPGSGPLSPPGTPVLSLPAPASSSSSSCPAITVDPESSFTPAQSPSPSVLTSSSPPLTSPPAPALLLDPLTALHQSDRASSSSGHASSLSPSPRATQSPPKQTLFSPCVDVFEPGPPSWGEDGEDQQEDEDVDDEEEDVGADESQYRHRRLTGDSGIEVCRCQVEEEEEEEEEEEGERQEDGRRGGGGGNGGERDKRGSGVSDLHDSVDCPARGQVTTGAELTLCNPAPTVMPSPKDGGDVVIVMETV
ncbi:mucin-5AC-like [Myripristis murdjan]|uniref:mucin-5AC-like n=1 Tax=Myripristis murdjan TaxID=586833 RepID=UPI001175DF31|nr:mucin-5AC-like [Myripristis murdjan]